MRSSKWCSSEVTGIDAAPCLSKHAYASSFDSPCLQSIPSDENTLEDGIRGLCVSRTIPFRDIDDTIYFILRFNVRLRSRSQAYFLLVSNAARPRTSTLV